jgi:hypothetical protein
MRPSEDFLRRCRQVSSHLITLVELCSNRQNTEPRGDILLIHIASDNPDLHNYSLRNG